MIIKCGSDGAFLVDTKAKKYVHISIVPNLIIDDTTGAGDAFCGGFIAGFFLTNDLFKASAYGAVSSSFVVESIGALKPKTYSYRKAKMRLKKLLVTNSMVFEDIQ